jgi:MFS family permease
VLHTDPTGMSLWSAARYVLSIRTNRVLIVSSALGYFFFSGLRTFAVVFLRDRFGVGQGVASTLLVAIGAGAILGVLITGRLGDRLIGAHHLTARPLVGGVAFLLAAALFLPGLLTTSLLVAAPLFFLAAAGIGGANPPLDAARLDLMHSRLWGRAEAVRTVLRSALEAIAPLLFGYVSTLFGAHTSSSGNPTASSGGNGGGLDATFLIMLLPLLLAGLLLVLRARRTYPRDVATAAASEHATATATEPDTPRQREPPMILAIALAVLGAAGNASASVLQRKAARDEPDANSFSIALVWHLAHRPVWIAGIASVIVGFLLQVVALGNGPISLVQPVLVLELPLRCCCPPGCSVHRCTSGSGGRWPR